MAIVRDDLKRPVLYAPGDPVRVAPGWPQQHFDAEVVRTTKTGLFVVVRSGWGEQRWHHTHIFDQRGK